MTGYRKAKVASVSVLIPARNEESTVEEVIDAHIEVLIKCLELKYITNYEIIVLDDGSTDNTFKKLSKYQGTKNLRILANEKSSGLQNAFKSLYDASCMTWVYLTPGDGQIPALNLEKFISEAYLSGWKFAILGNRDKSKQYSRGRLVISFLFKIYTSFLLSQKIPDVGTVKLVPSIINQRNYKCKSVLQEIERMQYLIFLKYPIRIVDIEWIARKQGKSHGASLSTLTFALSEVRFLRRRVR